MPAIQRLEPATLEALCKVLAETSTGLTGTEIESLLSECDLGDPGVGGTKWRRLLEALELQQKTDGHANRILSFVESAMKPVRYVHHQAVFDERRDGINRVLAFSGITLGDDGKLKNTDAATTISEASARAGRFRAELQRREVHAEVLKACQTELLEKNYFHAVLEATKSVAERIRSISGFRSDGVELVKEALGFDDRRGEVPRMAFNSLREDWEKSEHWGLVHMMKGVFSLFRNTTAHEPKVKWPIAEREALDVLTIVSLVHRRLDGAFVVRR